MRNYKPAVFQPTVRPDWGGALSYIPDDEKSEILVALFKYPSVECKSRFWLETIKPELDAQYAEFTRLCELKSRGIRDRWGKTSSTGLVEVYNRCCTGVIVPERERESTQENNNNNSRDNTSSLSTTRARKFAPPSLQEVIDYAAQQTQFRGAGGFLCPRATAEEFWAHYDSQGWRKSNDSATPVTNWQSALRLWCKKQGQFEKPMPDLPL